VIVHLDCPCGGVYEQLHVSVTFETDGRAVMLPAVPQGRCAHCGSLVYPAAALQMIEAAYKSGSVSAPARGSGEGDTGG
jgi:YgiT-type zinc finger domain-containing protein